jgi:hypothetical protein
MICYLNVCDVLTNVDLLHLVPIHVSYLVLGNQIKPKSEYINTQQAQLENITFDTHSETPSLSKTDIWILIVLAQNLPACWLEVFQLAPELAQNLPTCSSIGSEFTYLRPRDFRMKYQVIYRKNQ